MTTNPSDRPTEVCEEVLALVGNRAETAVLTESVTSALTRFANSAIHQNVAEERLAVSLKLAAGSRVASGSTTRADREGLIRLVETTLAAAHLRQPDPEWPGLASAAPVPDVVHHDPATEAATPAQRAEVVAAFVGAGAELSAAGYCETEARHIAFANSAGQRALGRATRATIDGIHRSPDSAGGAHQTSVSLAALSGAKVGAESADRARRGREAVEVPPADYEVVLEPECVATIALFLAAYGLNAKAVDEGLSALRPGQERFDPAFGLTDDATAPGALGLPFDAEGTPKRRVDLVSAGTVASLAHDRRTAKKAGTASTGHGLGGSEGDVWGPLPTNLGVSPGDRTRAELIASVGRGLLVTTFNYCRVLDPRTLVVTGLTRNGTFLIDNGELIGAVKDLRFTQSFLSALAPDQLLGAGREARFADSEFGAGLVVAPPLRLAAWHFTGGARG